ncbi:Protein of unknwon function DUF3008 [uncultured Caudovirales phage]|uniref:Protein of unknwon function DUF3008 n=1 Tax=uncultured Caudovirales phage TaxID=2100421 RepID=A0A6J5MA50_9CAUD|nr:Protein of unknwon function DUF3008 [uncultured Caudovirales phage]
MPATSKQQQKLMGIVHAIQKGEADPSEFSKQAQQMAKDMKPSDVKDFASTKHKGLPTKKEELKEKIRAIIREKMMREMNVTGNVQGYQTPYAFDKPGSEKKKAKHQADLTGYTPVNELNENRWLELKNENTPAKAKLDRGISNINKQLAEMEKFLNWYSRLKQESGVTNETFWKRTNRNIYSIKERLVKLEQKLRKISE